ncbi:MAG: ATP-binding protein, partial [Actinobacteria bacterium]|nr:ATP-binding protein [Actinomycetota bacterium]
MLPKAQTLEDIRRVCKPLPLAGNELGADGYFIETDRARDPNQDTRQRLADALSENAPARVLFYGHRGCGKSTVLNKFVAEEGPAFLPVQFSVEDEMTPSNARAEDLLLVIAERVLSAAASEDI